MGRGLFDRLDGELAAREKSPGLSMADLLTLPEPLSGLLKWLMRQRTAAFADVAAFLGGDEAQARLALADLLDKGLIRELEMRGATQYRVRLAPKRGRALPANLWQALSDKVEGEEEERP
ncbi:MAG: hypothetical protein JXM73_26240 [Anaerolineae bacterium]|nr:hypothetical protein [Anaerolineae bacterium]